MKDILSLIEYYKKNQPKNHNGKWFEIILAAIVGYLIGRYTK